MTGAVTQFLVRAAGEFRRGGYVFTGFHWPVLACQLAYRLPGAEFAVLLEAGAVCHGVAPSIPTSTTDYPALAAVTGFRGSTTDALFGLVRRCDRVVLDAANVDLRGRVNATAVGPYARPRVRLPGGGGAADAAAAAAELVLLHGGADPRRLQRRVEHVTAAPAAGVPVVLHTRWGTVRLGPRPVLSQLADGDTGDFVAHLRRLGVDVTDPEPTPPVTPAQRRAAHRVLREAAARGYRVARTVLEQEGGGD